MENDKMVRLEEMQESMCQAMANMQKVYEQQITLLEVIRASSKASEFKEFCDETSKQLQDMNNQSVILHDRIKLLEEVIDECKVDEKSKTIVLKVLDMFGIFEEK